VTLVMVSPQHDQWLYMPVPWVFGIEGDISVATTNPLSGLGNLVDDVRVEQFREGAPRAPLQGVGEGGYEVLGLAHGVTGASSPRARTRPSRSPTVTVKAEWPLRRSGERTLSRK
jgi:hypothetical protein